MTKESSFGSETGGAMVEATIALPALFIILFSAIYLIQTSRVSAVMRRVVNETGQFAMLGNTLPGLSRLESIKKTAVSRASRYGVKLSITGIQVCPAEKNNCQPHEETAGTAEQFISIRASNSLDLLPNFLSVDLSVKTVIRNEPSVS